MAKKVAKVGVKRERVFSISSTSRGTSPAR